MSLTLRSPPFRSTVQDLSPDLFPEQGSLTFADPQASKEDADIMLRSVGTARSTWLPELFRQSLPWFYDGAERVASAHYPQGLRTRRDGPVGNYLREYGVTGLRRTYAFAAAQLVTYSDREMVEKAVTPAVFPTERFYNIVRTLTQVGFDRDPFASAIEDIKTGPAALVALCESKPVVHLHLDSASWTKKRRRLREDALEAMAGLKRGYHIKLVASAHVEKRIRTQHHEWCDEHLTQHGPASGLCQQGDNDPTNIPEIDSELWDTLVDIPEGKRFELLAAIPENEDQRCTIQSLKDDSTVDIRDGTIDRYYRELEAYGLITVLEPAGSNEVYLTPNGRTAQRLLTEDGDLKHPAQTNLTDPLPHPPQRDTGKVCGGDGRRTCLVGQSFEEALRANERGFRGPKPRKLPLRDCWLDERAQFVRLASSQLAEGVTLVDEPIGKFEDGRATYFGTCDSEAHLIVQWGGALPTLVRSAVTLLSDLAFNRVLTRENLDATLSGPNALDELRRRLQVGWVSSTKHGILRGELQKRAHALLGQLSGSSGDPDLWSRVARDAHGLVTSATALFDAAGFDVTIHIRVPDTNQLIRDDTRYGEFLRFIQSTVPKNFLYKGHSASRLLLETDGNKLKYRFSGVVDTDDLHARSTANWVIIGPHATDFRDDVARTLERTPIRNQVADGAEIGIRIPVELSTTNSVSALVKVVESAMNRIGRQYADGADAHSFVRLYLYALFNPEQDRFASPSDVVESLLAADELTPPGEPLGEEEIVHGLGYVDPSRIYPWLPPSARAIVSALFRANEPLQRKEILDKTSVSESSYERHRPTLDRLGLLKDTGGYRYVASIPGNWPSVDWDPEKNVVCDTSLKQYWLVVTVEDALYGDYHLQSPVESIYIN